MAGVNTEEVKLSRVWKSEGKEEYKLNDKNIT